MHSPRALVIAALCFLLFVTNSDGSAIPAPALTPDAERGWIQLFDGASRFGWASGGGWKIQDNALESDPSQPAWLRTNASFSDFDLKFEARVVNGPATLLLRADPESKPAQPGLTLSLNDGAIAGI